MTPREDALLHLEAAGGAFARLQYSVAEADRRRVLFFAVILSAIVTELEDMRPRHRAPDPLAEHALRDPHVRQMIGRRP